MVGTVVDGSILEPRMLNSVSVLRAFDFCIYRIRASSECAREGCVSTLDLGVISIISDKVYALQITRCVTENTSYGIRFMHRAGRLHCTGTLWLGRGPRGAPSENYWRG